MLNRGGFNFVPTRWSNTGRDPEEQVKQTWFLMTIGQSFSQVYREQEVGMKKKWQAMYLSERFLFLEVLGLVNFLSCHRRKVRAGTARLGEILLPTELEEFIKDYFLKISLKISVCWQVYDMLPKYTIIQPAAKGEKDWGKLIKQLNGNLVR